MNIFSKLQVYAGKWNLKASRSFNSEEIAAISKAEVVPSQYGNSVCFFLSAGGQTYIPLSSDSELTVGDTVDLSSASLLTLEKEGEADILRVKA